MARLIDADALVALIQQEPTDGMYTEEIVAVIAEQTTIEATPVVHGRWVDRYGGKYANPVYDCSECKRKALYKPETDELGTERFVQELSDVCPNCGAKMVEKEAI